MGLCHPVDISARQVSSLRVICVLSILIISMRQRGHHSEKRVFCPHCDVRKHAEEAQRCRGKGMRSYTQRNNEDVHNSDPLRSNQVHYIMCGAVFE